MTNVVSTIVIGLGVALGLAVLFVIMFAIIGGAAFLIEIFIEKIRLKRKKKPQDIDNNEEHAPF